MADLNIYLIAKYTGQPKDPGQTHRAGYMKDPANIEYEEQVYITRGLHNKQLTNQVILNLTEAKIIKNTFKNANNFEELFTHYYDGYAEYIDKAVNNLNEGL
jgi:hypothetical protein